MEKLLLITITLLLTTIILLSINQINVRIIDFPEPEFVGESYIINDDLLIQNLEHAVYHRQATSQHSIARDTTKEKAAQLEIEGCCSATIIKKKTYPVEIIIKAESNHFNPQKIYRIVKLEVQHNRRILNLNPTILSMNSCKSNERKDFSGKANTITFSAKKYHESSYRIHCVITHKGEYAIVSKKLIDDLLASNFQSSAENILTFAVK